MHNNIMAAGSKDRPPMLGPGRYSQWRSRFLRYLDTKSNGEYLRKCIFEGPYTPTSVLIAAVEAAENILPVAAHEEAETIHNMTTENKLYFQAEKEAIFLILTGIGDEIYSTVDACNTAKEILLLEMDELELKMTLKKLSERHVAIQTVQVQRFNHPVTCSGDETSSGFNQMKRLLIKQELEAPFTVSLARLGSSYLQKSSSTDTPLEQKHDELVKKSLLTRSHFEGQLKEKGKVISDLKVKEGKDIDTMIEMDKQIKFLNEILYKRNQSIQTIHMLAPKCATYNGRSTFANPKYLKKAQSKKPRLYEIPYDTSDPANRFCPNGEETVTLEKESRSKLDKDKVKPYDYTYQNSLYETFKPPSKTYLDQLERAKEVRKTMWRKTFVRTKPNIAKNVAFLPISKSISKRVFTLLVLADTVFKELSSERKGRAIILVKWKFTKKEIVQLSFHVDSGLHKAHDGQLKLLYYITLLSKKEVVTGLPKLKYVRDQLCSSCEMSKAKRSSFKTKAVPSSKGRLNLLHMDLCGPMRVASINGKKYILVIVDDYSRYTWTLFLRSKDETPEVLKDFLTMIQRNLQAQVITVRTDRGTEFLNKTLHAYFKEEGIEHQTSTPRTPEQNGVVERRNRTLVEAARTMLSASKLPLSFWAEAVATACYTQNRSKISYLLMKKTAYQSNK
ncbi:retrovirus-related pol polyprotein from transposon TNT 1-94 [Tanacetum coccineum]